MWIGIFQCVQIFILFTFNKNSDAPVCYCDCFSSALHMIHHPKTQIVIGQEWFKMAANDVIQQNCLKNDQYSINIISQVSKNNTAGPQSIIKLLDV